MGSFLQSLIDPRKNWFARQHMKAVSKRLRHYGLRYDDMYDPYYDLDIKEALNRLPRQIVDARNQRLKRAMNLSMKHEYLPEDLQVYQSFQSLGTSTNVIPHNDMTSKRGVAPTSTASDYYSYIREKQKFKLVVNVDSGKAETL